MSEIAEKIKEFHNLIPEGVEMVAVSKFHPASFIRQAYDAGQKIFGESRVKEFLEKYDELPKDIDWHFIGHLQTNKLKPIIGKTALIESVDSERLLNLIDAESEKAGVITKVLLQVHVAREETKFGFYPEEILEYFNTMKCRSLKATHICGLMGMATNTDDGRRVRKDFETLHTLFLQIKNENGELRGFDKLSMGMSGDWELAVKEGSNIVRIGSAIFGNRY